MKQHADSEIPAVGAPRQAEPVGQPEDPVLGWYVGAEGSRAVCAVTTAEDGLCVIDEGADGAVLVEPRLEGIGEARALAADYLSLASERGEPQTRHPWPPRPGSHERGQS